MSAAHPQEAAVDPDRKRTLLIEARRDRVAWINAASDPVRGGGIEFATVGSYGQDMATLRASRACRIVRSAGDVAEALYRVPSWALPSHDSSSGEHGNENWPEEKVKELVSV